MVGEAMSNMRCTGSGEWVDPAGKLMYVDGEVQRATPEKPQQGKVQDTLRRFYAGRIGKCSFFEASVSAAFMFDR